MGRKTSQPVKDDFEFYSNLCLGDKILTVSPVELDEFKENHKGTRTKSTKVLHKIIPHDLNFIVESNISNHKDYKFKLFCLNRYNHPFFRFDSDGLTHKNNDPNIPLAEQSITTPHFHKYNQEGHETAFKTETLLNPGDTKALLEDINLGVVHFCIVANLVLSNSEYPQIVQTPTNELQLIINNDDPMRNISFD